MTMFGRLLWCHSLTNFDLNGSGGIQILHGHEDWSTIQYDFRGSAAASDGYIFVPGPNETELTYDMQLQLEAASGPPTVQAVSVNDGVAQRSRVTSVKVSFDQVVTLPAIAADAFELRRQSDNALVGLSANLVSGTTSVVTLTFVGALSESGSLADGRYTLTVFADNVSNAHGNLDGDGDGTGGGNFVSPTTGVNRIFRLFGDGDGDGDVDVMAQ